MAEIDLSKYKDKKIETYYNVKKLKPLDCNYIKELNLSTKEKQDYITKIEKEYNTQIIYSSRNINLNGGAKKDLYRPLLNYYLTQRNACRTCRNEIELGIGVQAQDLIAPPLAKPKKSEKVEKQAEIVSKKIDEIEKQVPTKKDTREDKIKKSDNLDKEIKEKVLEVLKENKTPEKSQPVKTNKTMEYLLAGVVFIGLLNIIKPK